MPYMQVGSITVLETEESYANILLGNYSVPEDFLRKALFSLSVLNISC